jgi:hypothetical protein
LDRTGFQGVVERILALKLGVGGFQGESSLASTRRRSMRGFQHRATPDIGLGEALENEATVFLLINKI